MKTGEHRPLDGPASTEAVAGLTEMNPYLALVLTICTGGLFGLFYASKVSSAYARRAAARKADAAGRALGRARHPVAVMVLSYLTGGIYFSYWTYRVMQECSVYTSGRDCESRSEMTLMLCFPPYAAYTALFRLPDLVKSVRKTAGATEFVVPAGLSPRSARECAHVASTAHLALGLRDLSRSDLIVELIGGIDPARAYVLESFADAGRTLASVIHAGRS